MEAFPSVFCLKSENNNQYLSYKHEDCQTHGVLQFLSQHALDAYTQFQVEKAKCDDGLIHLKCRWNDKYWVRWSRNHQWITGSSWEPNEDKSSWGCTLYKPTIVEEEAGKAKKIRLLHVQLEHYVLLKKIDRYPFDDCLLAGSKEIDTDSSSPCDVFTVIDWDSIYKVPKHVALKGDNGLYLGAKLLDDDKPCLAFLYKDPMDPKVGQQIIHFPDGSAYVKSDYYGKYWRVGEQDYMTVDADEPTGSKKDGSVLFRLTMVDVNIIALMNMTRIQFVKRYSIGDRDSFLCANTPYIDMWAKLQVTDLDN